VEALIHALVALPVAGLIAWAALRSRSAAVRIAGVVGALAAFAVVFVGSYSVFCTSCA
jgi:hypothetical protein